MFEKKHKYKLDYTPNPAIPRGLIAYIKMVVARNPRMWVFFIVTDILHGIRYPLAFYFMGQVVDELTAIPEGTRDIPLEVWHYTAAIFVVLFIGELAHAIPHYWTFDWWKRARGELRSDMLAYTMNHSFTYFQDHFAGSLARKVSEGIEKGLMLSEQLRWQILLPLIGMSTAGFVLLEVSPYYGMAVIGFIAIIIAPILLKIKKLMVKSRQYADSCSAVSGQIVDSLSNIASVKSYAREAQEMSEHTRVTEAQMIAWHKMLRVFLLLDNYRRSTLVLFGSGMMVACILGWQHGLLTLGDIATIMGISFSFTANAWHLSNGIIHVAESMGYLNDSLTTLINPHHVTDVKGATVLKVPKGEIVFNKVDFRYDALGVFNKLDLVIPATQRVGLIGESGAGKSTFINLLQRFFDIDGGEIRIDGQNIAHVTQNSLRQNIAIIPQDTALFHRTIMENIRYGCLSASDDEVMEAARQACAFDFITSLPDGFNTMVGERGVKLSGGQRQRVAIARAILKDAPILILDEATSALDSESEQQIQEALNVLMQGKTVIAVAHRLSTINRFDRLLVMDDGAIIEDGTHAELTTLDGVYNKLWALQSGGFLPK